MWPATGGEQQRISKKSTINVNCGTDLESHVVSVSSMIVHLTIFYFSQKNTQKL